MCADPTQRTVLVVDDDEDIRFALSRIVSKLGHKIVTADSAGDAEIQLSGNSIDIIFTDVNMETPLSGEQLLKKSSALFPLIPVIMMSSDMSSKREQTFRSLGAKDCLQKPLFADSFKEIIDQFCSR